MWSAVLKLVPFRDYAYAAAAIAAIAWYNVHVHNLEVAYAHKQVSAVTTAVAAATKKNEADAEAKIAALNTQHARDVAQVETKYEDQIKQNDADHATDLARLRQRAARSGSGNSNAVLGSAAGSGQAATEGSGNPGIDGLGTVPGALGLELVDALRADDAALNKCWVDRDDLVGK